ncbi:hypothetical protein [Halomonas sp. MES3-P3E]|uniref:hypothetical protein n=1 Tax=Halomonas sp. MES3-P3E TaxID=2058321 RepID=UPI0018E352C0|nr:hypothetical protein [Halomonas sp. MES3-P3E]
MGSQTNEQALETTIEQALTGMTTEEMKAAGDVRQTNTGRRSGGQQRFSSWLAYRF